MQPDALLLMILGWGGALGILGFCVVMLLLHPSEPRPDARDEDRP